MKKKPTEKPSQEALLSASRLLASVPHPNAAMTSEPAGEGLVVSVPMKRPGWLAPPLTWILPYSRCRRVELDALGRSVLELCDGRRTVEEIIETFAARHKLSFREGQVAVTQFLRELLRRGIIAIVGSSSQ